MCWHEEINQLKKKKKRRENDFTYFNMFKGIINLQPVWYNLAFKFHSNFLKRRFLSVILHSKLTKRHINFSLFSNFFKESTFCVDETCLLSAEDRNIKERDWKVLKYFLFLNSVIELSCYSCTALIRQSVKTLYLFIYLWLIRRIARLFPTVHYTLNLRDAAKMNLREIMERRYDFRLFQTWFSHGTHDQKD